MNKRERMDKLIDGWKDAGAGKMSAEEQERLADILSTETYLRYHVYRVRVNDSSGKSSVDLGAFRGWKCAVDFVDKYDVSKLRGKWLIVAFDVNSSYDCETDFTRFVKDGTEVTRSLRHKALHGVGVIDRCIFK